MDAMDGPALEMAEAVIVLHKTAKRVGDAEALALLEPLLRYAWRRLAVDYGPLSVRAELQGLCDGRPPVN